MKRTPELEQRLRELRAPGEAEAEERAWEVVREAHSERTPVRDSRSARRFGLAAAGAAAVAAIALSPAGAKVGDLVSDVVGVGEEDARPALRSLPAAGELLVETESGVWIVREDGSKRRLGEYREAVWSPNGVYVAAGSAGELAALDPSGEVQWTVDTPTLPRDITWEGSAFDTRIAYRAGGDLYVIGGDGLAGHRVARDVASTPPTWIPFPGVSKIAPGPDPLFSHVLAFVDRGGSMRIVEPDNGAEIDAFGELQPRLASQLGAGIVPSPAGDRTARVTREHGRSVLTVRGRGERDTAFSGPGRITTPVWSPDGRWLLFGWRDADQWVFLQPDRQRRVIAIDGISEQFESGGSGAPGFPRPAEWVLPAR